MNTDQPNNNDTQSSSQTDDYGFFLDLESNELEHDQVEFYVVATRTHYEVRRKVSKPDIIPRRQQFSIKDSHRDSLTGLNEPEKVGCFTAALTRIARLPSDIYYSCIVCTITVSCIYVIMTLDEPEQ